MEISINASATVTNTTFIDNYASSNGSGIGIRCNGNAIIDGCTIKDNKTLENSFGRSGGGIYIDSGKTVEIRNTIITGNSADVGGGILNDGKLKMIDTIIYGNQASGCADDIRSFQNSSLSVQYSVGMKETYSIIDLDDEPVGFYSDYDYNRFDKETHIEFLGETLELENILPNNSLFGAKFIFASELPEPPTEPPQPPQEGDQTGRAFYLACCALMCLCMILTFSRGAWLGLLFAGAVFFILLSPRLMLLIPPALALMWFTLPKTVIDRFASIGNLADASTAYRVHIWMGTLDMLKDYWLCGIGPGAEAFNMVYPAYSYNGIDAPHSHNLFLQITCDAGAAALAVFLILLFVYFRMMCVSLSREKDWTSRLNQVAFTGGAAGFLVQAMTDYSFYNYRVLFLFWVFLALGALCARRSELPERRGL